MDFLEGFLLGPLWSDTEFETRRHRGFYWSIGLFTSIVLVYLVLYPEKSPFLLDVSVSGLIALFFFLAILSPLLSHVYYRMILPVRLVILALQAVKYAAGMLVLLRQILPRISFNSATVSQDALDFVNNIIGKTTDYFTGMAQGTGMIVGILLGGLGVVFFIVAVIVVALIIPIAWLYVMRFIQGVIDQLAIHTVIRDM